MPFLVPVDKIIHMTKFEIEEENTKLQIARKLPLKPLFVSAFKWSAGQFSQIVKILRDEEIEENQKES